MRIAILYICTGKYDIFWKGFYQSCEKYFLKDFQKDYFVFTDAENLFDEENNEHIHKVYQERLGWPYDTLLRFKLFSKVEAELKRCDYVFFFNANAEILKTITPEEFLPDANEKLVAVLHPGYYNVSPTQFSYESKQKRSTAYIPKGKGKHYFAGGLNGGLTEHYLELIRVLKKNIEKDLSNDIIAVWHDESHLNHYMLHRSPKILSPSYIYPEGWNLPYEPIILIRDKGKHGGHNFLRDVENKKPLKKKIAELIKKYIMKW